MGDHVCFGCGKQVQEEQLHIHGSPAEFLDEDPGPLDALFPELVYCEECIVPGGKFDPHRHKIEIPPSGFADIFK